MVEGIYGNGYSLDLFVSDILLSFHKPGSCSTSLYCLVGALSSPTVDYGPVDCGENKEKSERKKLYPTINISCSVTNQVVVV